MEEDVAFCSVTLNDFAMFSRTQVLACSQGDLVPSPQAIDRKTQTARQRCWLEENGS